MSVADPYRWLEDGESDETKAWIASQQALYGEYAGNVEGKVLQQAIRARQEGLYNYERVGLPIVKGGRSFFFRNTGLLNQDILFVSDAAQPGVGATFALDVEPKARMLLNLNAEYPEGTTSLSTYSVSNDGSLLAYGLAHAGSDWVTVRVRDVATAADLPNEEIAWVKFSSLAWTADDSGFFYSRYPAPTKSTDAGTETAANANASVCFHRARTPSTSDLLVYATPEQPLWRAAAWVSDDGRYVYMSTSKGTDPVNRLYVTRAATFAKWAQERLPYSPAPGEIPPLQNSGSYLPVRRVIDNFDAEYDVVAEMGNTLYLKTNLRAPRGRIIALRLPWEMEESSSSWEDESPLFKITPTTTLTIDEPALPTPEAQLKEVLPQHATEVLDWATHVAGDVLVTCVLKDVVNVLRVMQLPPAAAPLGAPLGPSRDVPLPGPGTVASFAGRPELDNVFIKFVSFTTPGSSLCFNAKAALTEGAPPAAPFWSAMLPGFDADDFVVKQDFVDTPDGARVPIFLVHKRALSLPAPTLLYAYGGFGINMQPSFSSLRLAWLTNLGGVFALACIRGGGEYGKEAWHDAGRRLQKRNCFNDFAAVATALSSRGVTSAAQLCVMGGSNGGLLTLAAAQRTPGLYAAAVSQVPVGDLLRFSLFTIGHAWQGEYGFVSDREDFFNLLSLSPYHQALAAGGEGGGAGGALPSVLVCTADHDDRVVPLHSYKVVAALQAGAGVLQTRPLLLRVESKAGHGAGKPTSKILDESSEVWAFIARETGAKWGR